MKILFVVPYQFLPPDSGNKNLLYNLLKYATAEASCDLALLVDDSSAAAVEAALRREYPALKTVVVFAKPRGIALWTARICIAAHLYHPSLGRYLNRALAAWLTMRTTEKSYDLIHFDMVHTAIYRKFCENAPTLLVASDAYSMSARDARRVVREIGYAARLMVEEWLLKRFEKMEYPRFNMVCAVSVVDANYLQKIAPGAVIRTIGIAVAPEYVEREILHFGRPRLKRRILCTGSIDHRVVADDLIDFLEKCLPHIRKQYPDVETTVLGRRPAAKLKKCMERATGVEHVAFVEDYADFLDQDWVYVYPQRVATGLQTKVQQAMALGLPVVGYNVSFGGLSVESGRHCFMCKDINDMSNHVLSLVGDHDLRCALGAAAARHVRENFSIKKVGDRMFTLYRELCATPT